MSPKIVRKRDGYNMFFFKSGSHNDPKKRSEISPTPWSPQACNKRLNYFLIGIFSFRKLHLKKKIIGLQICIHLLIKVNVFYEGNKSIDLVAQIVCARKRIYFTHLSAEDALSLLCLRPELVYITGIHGYLGTIRHVSSHFSSFCLLISPSIGSAFWRRGRGVSKGRCYNHFSRPVSLVSLERDR